MVQGMGFLVVRCAGSLLPTSNRLRELSPPPSLPTSSNGFSHRNAENKSPTTYVQDFQGNLQESLAGLLKARPYYVHCIRSNISQTAGHFDKEVVGQQIQHMAVFETVDFMQCG